MQTDVARFDPVHVSSKFAICGLPIRVDTYQGCTFGCKYCFANNRIIMGSGASLQVGDVSAVERRLSRVFDSCDVDHTNFLDHLISDRITWHCGGMSDPFQPAEKAHHVTRDLIDVCNKHGVSILFSTKADCLYGCNVKPELHTFQLSVTNANNRRDIEPNVPDIESRYQFYRQLKRDGFRVGIRIQPFIPDVSTLEIAEMFRDADNFTLEGLKLVPQNKEQKDEMMSLFNLRPQQFKQMGLLNLLPEIRLDMYAPFIDFFEKNNIPYSIADNDLHHIGTNYCCCGDRLVDKSTSFNNTAMVKKYGCWYGKEHLDDELCLSGYRDCKACQLFASNRQEGCVSVQDFFDKRFYRKSSPFSPQFLHGNDGQQEIRFAGNTIGVTVWN